MSPKNKTAIIKTVFHKHHYACIQRLSIMLKKE